MKDAFYFPHFSNARNDRKLKRVRKDLGLEGYGAFFMLLEILRDEGDFKYPLGDIDMLADEVGISEIKLKGLIGNYGLFQTDQENFFSLKFLEYLQPYIKTKARNRINGIKGNLIRYGHATKEQLKTMTDLEVIEFSKINDNLLISGGESGGDRDFSQRKGKERKGKESKVKESIKTLEDNLKDLHLSIELENKFIEYIKFRKEIKKPIKTLRTITSSINKIGKTFTNETHLIESLDFSMDNEYQGVIPIKQNFNKSKNTEESYIDRMIRENNENNVMEAEAYE